MNYSKWIGATVRHSSAGRLVIKSLSFNSAGEIIFYDTDGRAGLLSHCKRIRIVKRKKSQVLIDALGHISKGNDPDCCERISSVNLGIHYEEIAKAALEKYREKTKGAK